MVQDDEDSDSLLIIALHSHNFEAFKELYPISKGALNQKVNENQTILQYACEKGLYDFVDLLVNCESEADVSASLLLGVEKDESGLQLACEKGFYKIVNLLIEYLIDTKKIVSYLSTIKEPILVTVTKNYITKNQLFLNTKNEGRDYVKCLKIILIKKPRDMDELEHLKHLGINKRDRNGNTALYYAAQYDSEDILGSLLVRGAHIGTVSETGMPALAYISREVLQACLNQCISTNGQLPSDYGFEVIFNYGFLVPTGLDNHNGPTSEASESSANANQTYEPRQIHDVDDTANAEKTTKTNPSTPNPTTHNTGSIPNPSESVTLNLGNEDVNKNPFSLTVPNTGFNQNPNMSCKTGRHMKSRKNSNSPPERITPQRRSLETDPLSYISKSPELYPVLKHPVLKSFIHYKWQCINWLFYINFAFYTLFWLLLGIYTLFFFKCNGCSEIILDQNNETDCINIILDQNNETGCINIIWNQRNNTDWSKTIPRLNKSTNCMDITWNQSNNTEDWGDITLKQNTSTNCSMIIWHQNRSNNNNISDILLNQNNNNKTKHSRFGWKESKNCSEIILNQNDNTNCREIEWIESNTTDCSEIILNQSNNSKCDEIKWKQSNNNNCSKVIANHNRSTNCIKILRKRSELVVYGGLWWMLVFLLVILAARELFQLALLQTQYVTTSENWLEIGIIIVAGMILFFDPTTDFKNIISVLSILFSSGELLLHIGRHPRFSTKAEMFKTVTIHFFKVLTWYSMLILAFALSFYSLFKNENQAQFSTIDQSIFKTVFMFTGQFEFGSFTFNFHPWASNFLIQLIVVFIVLIAIVLSNLLIGLAVSDTQQIVTNAEVVGLSSLVRQFSCFETVVQSSCVDFLARIFCRCSMLRALPSKIRVLPNRKNKVKAIFGRTEVCEPFVGWRRFFIEESLVKEAKEILKKELIDKAELKCRNENKKILLSILNSIKREPTCNSCKNLSEIKL